MKIALTGASSFTGCHMAHALVSAGFEVVSFFTKPLGHYKSGDLMIQKRLVHAGLNPSLAVYNAPFGSPEFLAGLEAHKPGVFINHGADIKGYRSPDFDVDRSVKASTQNLSDVMRVFKKIKLKGFVHSGTVFEPIDGLEALSPYGESKFRVSNLLEAACKNTGLLFSKVYIANPIGAFENSDRLIPVFAQKWLAGEVPHLAAPKVVFDHVPVPWIASLYVNECKNILDSKVIANTTRVLRPSGFCLSLEQLVKEFIEQAQKQNIKSNFDYTVAQNDHAPPPRLNTEPCVELKDTHKIKEFYTSWVDSFFNLEPR